MIRREFAFLLDAWLWCQQHGIDNWQERLRRKNWGTWVLTVPGMTTKDMRIKANTL